MSLQSATEFAKVIIADPALMSEVTATVNGKNEAEASSAISALGKSKGYDFTPQEAATSRQSFMKQLSDDELNSVAGGATDPVLQQTLTTAGSIIGGQVVTGGGMIGAGVGAGVATAIGGGSAQESVLAGANATNASMNQTKGFVQQVFSGW